MIRRDVRTAPVSSCRRAAAGQSGGATAFLPATIWRSVRPALAASASDAFAHGLGGFVPQEHQGERRQQAEGRKSDQGAGRSHPGGNADDNCREHPYDGQRPLNLIECHDLPRYGEARRRAVPKCTPHVWRRPRHRRDVRTASPGVGSTADRPPTPPVTATHIPPHQRHQPDEGSGVHRIRAWYPSRPACGYRRCQIGGTMKKRHGEHARCVVSLYPDPSDSTG